jgi:hypothetical protein
MTLPKEHLEDEIWSLIRMSPEKLPLETYKCCLLFFHLENGVPKCDSVNRKQQNDTSCYTRVQKLNRKLKSILKINFHIAS